MLLVSQPHAPIAEHSPARSTEALGKPVLDLGCGVVFISVLVRPHKAVEAMGVEVGRDDGLGRIGIEKQRVTWVSEIGTPCSPERTQSS